MSNKQPSRAGLLQKVERGRPHFRHIPRKDEFAPYEQAVIDAGYPWVRTNPLIPTWMSPDRDTRPNTIPDRLNQHGHHGINTHLIVQGDLTLRKERIVFGQNSVSTFTLSTEPGAMKEFSVAPHEMYSGTTEQSCRFVEGHRNLSPGSARRYMSRYSLEWVDKTGRAVQGDERDYVLKQLDSENVEFKTEFNFKHMRRVATCEFKEDNQITRSLRQWFLREWNDPDVQEAKGDLRPAIHPLEPRQAPQEQQDHDMDDCDDEYDDSGDKKDHDDKDGGAVLAKAFQDWLTKGLGYS
ncbi:hypothetical protein diail_11907 [Diaporthe ilicicola]|nr:hypothetical protein diail_11907 [Diaporthe ilicicola]